MWFTGLLRTWYSTGWANNYAHKAQEQQHVLYNVYVKFYIQHFTLTSAKYGAVCIPITKIYQQKLTLVSHICCLDVLFSFIVLGEKLSLYVASLSLFLSLSLCVGACVQVKNVRLVWTRDLRCVFTPQAASKGYSALFYLQSSSSSPATSLCSRSVAIFISPSLHVWIQAVF